MSLSLFKKLCVGSMLGFVAWTTSSFAQTPVTVNGAACAGASVTFSNSGIAISTAGCGGTVVTPPSITNATPPDGTLGSPYSYSFGASGGTPITWTITNGALPAGLTLSSAGVLSGTPTAITAGAALTIQASNAGGIATQSVTVVVTAGVGPPVITSSSTLPNGSLNALYTFQFTATGAPGITWAVASGSTLPAGLTLAPTGVLSGTPTAAVNPANFTVQATNTAGTTPVAATLTIVAPVAPAFTSAAPLAGSVGASYSHTFAVSGTTPIAWSITGTPPAGLTFNTATGVLSGTPSSAATTNFTVTATNGGGNASQAVALTVNPNNLGDVSVENVVIPTPSKYPNVVPNPRNGQLNGAGPDLNAYAVDVSRCAGKTSPTLTRSWQHNIEFASYAGESPVDYVTMNAGEALSFRFVAPATGYRFITFNPATLGRYVGNFLSISTSPCDFNDSPPSNMRACYAARNSGNNDITYQVVGSGAPDISACKLTPGTVYYFNLRFWDKVGGNPVDACAVDTVANGFNCGGILQIR